MGIAKYLIEHGADQNKIDINGKKPHEYSENETNAFSLISNYFLKKSRIYKDLFGKESQYYHELLGKGIDQVEAIDLTYERYPELKGEEASVAELKDEEVRVDTTPTPAKNLDAMPTMNKLIHYVSEMASHFYTIGLELDIPNSKLKLIKKDTPDTKEQCREMLELWLEIDPSASWEKLCNALEESEAKLLNLAKQIRTDLEKS